MSWTYASPSGSTTDQVRFLTGQTSSGDPVLLLDEEISWALTEHANVYYAAALCADTLASRYLTTPQTERIGETAFSWGDRSQAFADRAKMLRGMGLRSGVSPFVGGTSISDVETRREDTDRVSPNFWVGRDDFPYTNDASTTSTG